MGLYIVFVSFFVVVVVVVVVVVGGGGGGGGGGVVGGVSEFGEVLFFLIRDATKLGSFRGTL